MLKLTIDKNGKNMTPNLGYDYTEMVILTYLHAFFVCLS